MVRWVLQALSSAFLTINETNPTWEKDLVREAKADHRHREREEQKDMSEYSTVLYRSEEHTSELQSQD